jgi:uncharacterized tellurite resistance protein B-like protein
MDILLHKKINILIHLAKADGKFDDTERHLLHSLLAEHNYNPEEFLAKHDPDAHHGSLEGISGKAELLYWAIKLMQADGIIHPDEVSYCKKIAGQLKFQEGLIDRYAHSQLPSLVQFEREIETYKLR